MVLNKFASGSVGSGNADGLPLEAPEVLVLWDTFDATPGDGVGHDDAQTPVYGDGPLVESIVVQCVEQKAVLGGEALGRRICVSPWLDVASD